MARFPLGQGNFCEESEPRGEFVLKSQASRRHSGLSWEDESDRGGCPKMRVGEKTQQKLESLGQTPWDLASFRVDLRCYPELEETQAEGLTQGAGFGSIC